MRDDGKAICGTDRRDGAMLCWPCVVVRACDDRAGDDGRFGEVNVYDCDDIEPGSRVCCDDCGELLFVTPMTRDEQIDNLRNYLIPDDVAIVEADDDSVDVWVWTDPEATDPEALTFFGAVPTLEEVLAAVAERACELVRVAYAHDFVEPAHRCVVR